MRRRLLLITVGAAFLLGPAAAAWAQEASVSIEDFEFNPATSEVTAGTTLTWTNNGEVDHTATADDGTFDSGVIEPGGTYSFTFDEEGEFPYICEIHPNMQGTVTILAAEDNGGGGGDTDDPTDPTDTTDEDDEALPETGAEVGAFVYLGLAFIGTGMLCLRLERSA